MPARATTRRPAPPAGRASGRHTPPGPPLIATKLHPPAARRALVGRPRLLALLDDTAAPIALVVAPAGFGKTTLLVSWLQEAEGAKRRAQSAELVDAPLSGLRPSAPAPRVAWLSLDAGDNDPATFARYLVAALRRAAPGVGADTLAAYLSPQPPALEAALAPLLNELAALAHPLALVLDDYHLIESPAVHAGLALLAERLPAQLRLVLTSRSEPPLPLARLRARGLLAELRADDLRFSGDEAAALLSEAMGLRLPAAELAELERRTEGWAAGLQLAALALRGSRDHARLIAAVHGGARLFADYLAAEALDRLPARLRRFLLQTSVLGRMCGELCDQLLGADGPPGPDEPPAALLLEELERLGLFVVALDERRAWFRYHQLFGEMLHERLRREQGPARESELHRRAAGWFAAQGLAGEAIEHALAGGDTERAAQLIAAHATPLLFSGGSATVRAWLEALPPQLVRERADLTLTLAWAALFSSDVATASALAEQAAALPDQGDGALDALRSILAGFAERYLASAEAGRRALERLPERSPLRSIVAAGLAFSAMLSDDLDTIEALARAELAGATLTAGSALLRAHFELLLGMAERVRGRLRSAAELGAAALARLESSPFAAPSPTLIPAINELATTRYEQGDLAAAAALSRRARSLCSDAGGMGRLSLAVGWLEARLLVAAGDPAGAELLLAAHAEAARAIGVGTSLAMIEAERAAIAQRAGDGAGAARAASAVEALERAGFGRGPFGEGHLAPARTLLATGQAAAAAAALAALRTAAEAGGRGDLALRSLALEALARQQAGDSPAALDALDVALGRAAAEGQVRLFLDEGPPMAGLLAQAAARRRPDDPLRRYAERLLREAGRGGQRAEEPSPHLPGLSPQPAALAEPISPRELEVLRLLAAGRSNRAIAAELTLALGTVKRHVANLCGKLGVESRLAAVARGRELGMI